MYEIIMKDIRAHKKFIIAYISILLVVAVFVSPFFGFGGMFVKASEETVPTEETIYSLSQMFIGPSIKNLAGAYASVVGVSAEPFTALLFLGLMENINRACGSPLHIVSTPAGNPIVLLVMALFFLASKLMKSFETTKVFGLCTLGELEKYLGLVFILVLGILNVVGITDMFAQNTVSAASAPVTASPQSVALGIFGTLFSVFMALVSVVVYLVIKTVFFGLDALQSCFSFIPFSGALFEIFKTVFVIVVISVNILFPWVGVAINIIVFLICCLLFRFFLGVEEFLRKIYIKPFIARLRGFNDEIPLVYSKVPKFIKKYCEANEINYNIAIPAYCFKKKEAEGFKMKFMDKIWILNTEEGPIFLKKKGFKNIQKYELFGKEKKYYLKKEFRFIEIFSNPKDELFKKKDLRAVISVEYVKRFEELCEMFNFENYHVVKENLKLSKKEEKLQRREERKEKIKEKVSAFTDSAVEKLKPAYTKVRNALPFKKDDDI